ncbi:MAG TPA: nucleotidyltransferase domain-containing protein [Longimicrobium sp.]|nr:nucleotidyltransferase domain-containing protein [Longimicrobium sp.]
MSAGATMGREMERAQAYARDLAGAYGEALVSVVLYGSAARGEYREGVSDLNLLVLLSSTDAHTLRRGSALARAWAAENNPPPLLMSEAEFRASADVFPMELADMNDAHVVLHGENPFHDLEIRPDDLRLQLERELKGAWIRLRTRYLTESGDALKFQPMLLKSLSTFLVFFRTVLRLSGHPGTRDPETVLNETAARVGFDPQPLLAIHRARSGAAKLDVRPDSAVVTGYLEAVARVVEYVDRFERPA